MRKKLKNKAIVISRHWSSINSSWSKAIASWSLVLLVLLSSCMRENNHQHEADVYTCPMHPTVIQDKPGTCPVCGMELVLKSKHVSEVALSGLKSITKSPNEVVVSSIKTTTIQFKELPVLLKVQGLVTYDTRNLYTIPSRFSGRIEKIYAQYPYQKISKGDKLAIIYSPEISTAEQELIYLIKNDKENIELIKSAKQKLSLLGLSQKQIDNIVSKEKSSSTTSIYSAFNGYLINDEQKAPSLPIDRSPGSASGMGGGMNTSASSNSSSQIQSSTSSLIREGNYVSAGQTLFKLINTSSIRVELDLPISQSATIKAGDDVDLFINNKIKKARVDFVQPYFNKNEGFVKVRIYVEHSEDMQVGELVSATLKLKPVASAWLPQKAVVDLGLDKIVFIKKGNAFKPMKITSGFSADNLIEVKGLASDASVAYNAQYLIDSEGFIKTSK